MMQKTLVAVALLSVALLSGCGSRTTATRSSSTPTTSTAETISSVDDNHQRMVDAAVQAVVTEGGETTDITRETVREGEELVTVIKAPYKRTSRLQCRISSKNRSNPSMAVAIENVTFKNVVIDHSDNERRFASAVHNNMSAPVSRPTYVQCSPGQGCRILPLD